MKPLEDAFASDMFRRVILPGIVLTAGIHPLVSRYVPKIQELYSIGPTALIIIEVIVLGLIISSGTQRIYYFYEGFRLTWLTSLAGRLNRRKLKKRLDRADEIYQGRDYNLLNDSEKDELGRIFEYLRDFPILRSEAGSTIHMAERPTRLGNIIASYELYSESRYGIDATSFWYHFMNLASDGTRKAFEDKYSFAESMVLASFAGALVAAIQLAILLCRWLTKPWLPNLINISGNLSVALLIFGVLIWSMFYLLSLPAHREAGAAFRSIIDGTYPKFVEWIKTLKIPPDSGTISEISRIDEYLKRPE